LNRRGGGGEMGRRVGKRRAGELYDAFAAGSEDEEDEAFSEGGDEREKKLYEDDDGEGSERHVVGDDDDESVLDRNEKMEQHDKLLTK